MKAEKAVTRVVAFVPLNQMEPLKCSAAATMRRVARLDDNAVDPRTNPRRGKRMSTAAVRASHTQRIPLNTLAIGFGMTGLAVVWSSVSTDLNWQPALSGAFWLIAAIAWGWLIVAHLHRGFHSNQTLASQLRHPAQGPIAAIVPAVGMLLGSELYLVSKAAGTVLTLLSLVTATTFAGWILAHWHRGHLNPEAFHGAFLLPTVAAAFIASIAATRLGLPGVAFASFGIGVFFWIAILTVLLARLAFFPPLPDALTPTLAILLAPPAVGGAAWFAMNGVEDDPASLAFLGILVLMLIVQMFMLGTYRRLAFTLGFWSFTFPVASAASYGIQWLQLANFEGRELSIVGLAVLSTVLTAAIAIRSLILITSVGRGIRRAEQSLRRADDAVSRPASIPGPPEATTKPTTTGTDSIEEGTSHV